jgi:intracellular sulfur oxidation DsrE/DsrF family protein
MQLRIIGFVLSLLTGCSVFSQQQAAADIMSKKTADSLHWESLKKTLLFPLIKNSEESGVLPVPVITEKADPAMKYKLLFHMIIWSKDSNSIKKINEGLAEIGRIINMHVAAGVPKENLELAIVVNGGAMNVFLKDGVYQNKFKTGNPNLDIIRQFADLKTALIVCGQSEVYRNFPPEDFLPGVKTAFSAKVAISTYQLKGYVLFEITEQN